MFNSECPGGERGERDRGTGGRKEWLSQCPNQESILASTKTCDHDGLSHAAGRGETFKTACDAAGGGN